MSSTLNEALRFRALGQARHIERGYNVAIDEFTDALKLHDVPFNIRMGILDNRAAAWEMIGTPASLDLALEDARVMTQLSGDQAAGCLRAGEIFQLRGQDESALEIYAYGIKHVKPGGPGFEALNQMFKEVQSRVALREVRHTTGGRDPLRLLPVELAEWILHYVPFQTLMTAQRVSRAWRSFIRASRNLYTCLDFSGAARAVPHSSLRTYINRSWWNVREAALFRLNDDTALSILIRQCRYQLSVLSIRQSQITLNVLVRETCILPNLTVFVTDIRFFMDGFREILEACASLRTFECRRITCIEPKRVFTANLRRLKIWDDSAVTIPSSSEGLLRDIVRYLPKLEEVEFMDRLFYPTVDFRPLDSLSVLVLNWSRTMTFPLLPESIRVLDISQHSSIRWSVRCLESSPLPNLESFTADNNPYIKNVHVLAILAPSLEKRSLRSLSLDGCRSMDFNPLEWLMKHGENLESLRIGGNSTVTDEVLKEVAGFRKLRYLGLSTCGISGTGLMNVVYGSSPGMLREVDVSGCLNIGWDEVQSAKKSGVNITQRVGGRFW